ncbi:MAG TPA: Stf0 family sulfotransferase [Candidatus Sulfotelmatobacter sp.]|nr:Stf0 family sulfotransferase [Candidatus Sulfotelmatobacter sp.]
MLPIMMPSRGYLLCCIERTGSNLLLHPLAASGMAGRPKEYFNPVEQDTPWMREILGDSTLVGGLPRIVQAATTPNGMFGAKVHWVHFRYLGMSITGEWKDAHRKALYELLRSRLSDSRSHAATMASLRSGFFSHPALSIAYTQLKSWVPDLRMIWLRRQNMVARAVSLFRARQSGIWYQSLSKSSAVIEKQAPVFDFAEINTLYCLGWLQEESWQQFFQQNKISSHCVLYEELVANYESTVRRTLQFLDIDSEQKRIAPPVSAKQSDALSEEWAERYRKMSTEGGFHEF